MKQPTVLKRAAELRLRGIFKTNVSLKEHTTFKIGGPAQYFFEPADEQELRSFLLVFSKKISLRVLGAGSNILVSDRGVRGIVIVLSSPFFQKVEINGNSVFASAGVSLPRLIKATQMQGLSGLEYLHGIPGTVGGALAMNAGAGEHTISDTVRKIEMLEFSGKKINRLKKQINWKYRVSGLDKYIITGAWFELTKTNPLDIKERIHRIAKQRIDSQDYRYPNAGCIFKNPVHQSAGRLIDACGFKGQQYKGAQVSSKHANFILNTQSAHSHDVSHLMKKIQNKVYDTFKVKLVPEIKIWH